MENAFAHRKTMTIGEGGSALAFAALAIFSSGLMFKQDIAAAEQQDSLHWQVDGKAAGNSGGSGVLEISARDTKGAPLTGLSAQARLAHPADERLDHVVMLDRIGAGQFHGEAPAQPGQWELIVDLFRTRCGCSVRAAA